MGKQPGVELVLWSGHGCRSVKGSLMASIVENLLPLFGIQDEDTSHEALCQHIRDVVNEDTSGDLSLADEIEHARNKFEDLYAGGEFAPSVAGQLRNIGEVSKALQVVHKEQLDARAELDKEFADLASEISVAQDIPTEQDEDEEPKDGEEENDDADDEGEEEEEKTGEVETVSADGSPAAGKVWPASCAVRLPTASALNGYRPEQQTNYGGSKVRYQIVAAADVPRTPSGSSLNIRELGEAVNRKFSTLPVGQRNVSPRRGSVALIRRNFDRSLKTYSDKRDISTIDRVADERNLPGGSLIAAARSHRQALTAAGCCTDMSNDIWCAPSEKIGTAHV